MDWSEKDVCIKCNEGENLLVCNEMSCPLSIHEKCMGCPVRLDDAGHFYCPYCLYKRAVVESRQARENALSRKKALSIFMDEVMIGRDKQTEVNEGGEANGHNNQSKVIEANENITTCGDEENKVSGAENEKHPEEERKISDGEEIRDEVHEEASEGSSSRDKKAPGVEIETSSGSSGLDSVPLRERAKRAAKRRKTVHGDSEAVSVKSNSVEQSDKNKQTSPNVNSPRRSSATNRTEEVKKEMVKDNKKLKKSELSSFKLGNDTATFSFGKRKRLLWREEEEEVLKAGVDKYMNEPTKNLPWRKILDLGRNVFDVTRTPSDLKDKWRNMTR